MTKPGPKVSNGRSPGSGGVLYRAWVATGEASMIEEAIRRSGLGRMRWAADRLVEAARHETRGPG